MRHHAIVGRAPLVALLGCAAWTVLASHPGARAQARVPWTEAGGDTLITVVPARGGAEVRSDLEAALSARQSAESAFRRATDLRDRSRVRIEVQKKEISTLNSRLKLAKKEKNQAETGRLEDELERMKLRLRLLERRAELRAAEIDLARALRSLADASVTVHEHELELAGERDQRWSLAAGASDAEQEARALAARAKMRELEGRVLAAQRTEAERRMDAARREGKLAERRQKLFEAQLKLLGH